MIEIHFLNVGHGDCTIIEFGEGGRIAVVDINNSRTLDADTRLELAEQLSADELGIYEEHLLADPVEYFLNHFADREIFRYIQTHPDMDHMTGLYRLHAVEGVSILNLWDTKHAVEKSADPKDWENTPYDQRDWEHYSRLRASETDPKALFYLRGDRNSYYKEDGVYIWSPFEHGPDLDEGDDINELSYVLYIKHGECRIVLGGDAPVRIWEKIYEGFDGEYPKINLLKAPHHGRKSGYHWQSVKAMRPDYTVVSVGKLRAKDDAFASYEKYSEKGCYSTRFKGTVVAKCWADGDVWLYDRNGTRL